MKRFLSAISVIAILSLAPRCPAEFMRGADLSLVSYAEDHGVQYKQDGQTKDPLLIFKDHGCNYVRLRLFVNPDGTGGQVNTLPYTLKLAKRVRAAGLNFLLDFHYSDKWADPGHQQIPAAWKTRTHDQLLKQLSDYTRDTLNAFKGEDAMPGMVEIGNEITNGMMWPDGGPLGKSANTTGEDHWSNLADLIKAGVQGLRESDPSGQIKVMIHIDKGGDKNVSRWFFDNLVRRGVSFDVIGLSYYPFWNGSLDDLKANLASLSTTYKKDIVVVETAYDANGGSQGTLPYPPTPQGQRDYISELIATVAATPDGHGQGICVWEPDWIEGDKWQASGGFAQWENRAFFDGAGNMRPAMEAFAAPLPINLVSGGKLPTRWDKYVSPTNPHNEYPRPQMARLLWKSLNGPWNYALTDGASTEAPVSFDHRILVPYCYESALSGSAKPSIPNQRLWYRRSFEIPPAWKRDQRILLHFDAVNWDSTVSLNGKPLGHHIGGYDAFEFDITDDLKPWQNELIVSVRNPLLPEQVLGKQVMHPGGTAYTAATGIWQTVWLEPVPVKHISDLKIVPDIDAGTLTVTANSSGDPVVVTVTVMDDQKIIVTQTGKAGAPVSLPIANAHLWSPADPHLYSLHITTDSGDSIDSYAAMRKISLGKDEHDRVCMTLNNKPVFQVGTLDQGYWPDGIYTAPTDDALKYDIETAKRLGLNLLRKHAKIEPDRWYYWTDKLGMLVWQDMPQAFADHFSDDAKQQWLTELKRMIASHDNHPSIIAWTLFNEGWGQHDTEEITRLTRQLDPTRLINSASGGYNQVVNGKMSQYRYPTPDAVGDINDTHTYPDPSTEKQDPNRALVCGEFGGISMRVHGHLWTDDNFGYGQVVRDSWHLTRRYEQLLNEAYVLRDHGACGVVYTQLVDVEQETNGLMTYDREIMKPLPEIIAAANCGQSLPLPPAPVNHDLVPTSEEAAKTWSYTTQQPADDWMKNDFNAASWKTGPAPFGQGYPVNTNWSDTPGDIWLRRTITLPRDIPAKLNVLAKHDEDVEVYINGIPAARATGYTADYATLQMSDAARATLQPGRNLIAVHCHQTTGGQVIDVGIAER